MKLINNMLGQIATVAIAGALVLGKKAGLDPQKIYEVVRQYRQQRAVPIRLVDETEKIYRSERHGSVDRDRRCGEVLWLLGHSSLSARVCMSAQMRLEPRRNTGS
jgi:NAD-binding of NADP-dependent 3-hydroxyisobutyrate dehydrogenase